MATLNVTEEQLRLIQQALDFYSRVGIGQFNEIKNHPTFERHLHKEFSLGSGDFKVGDNTMRGEVVEVEVDPKGKWIKTKGIWDGGEEVKKWTDVENIEYSTDYERYHQVRDAVDMMLVQPRNMLYNDMSIGKNGSWGIHHPSVDDSCRDAFDLVQVIRHEFWKRDPDRSSITVDSHIHLTGKNTQNIEVEL
jgi:hypothetical protein